MLEMVKSEYEKVSLGEGEDESKVSYISRAWAIC